MTYIDLMYIHLATVVPCFVIGTIVLMIKKGTNTHIVLGRIYMMLMMFTAIITLFMPAHVGPTVMNHFGWIHAFSFLTIYTVPTAYWAIKQGNVKAHKRKMIILYIGAIIIAGGFTFAPGRYLNEFLF
ncbi:DUF2306 domain-containing protein [Wenyingzhuangia sp. 2_MG-2023]|uniref:DUF2306 domain-containing protein n=1 Tax=Wenyingzhuangia sp. 2_MG-2023 TaxID=3062639 RepID=UPI0026E28752|nr:DUF2306 domain-containing protein [Wenyingzhuangia sp. 2_MG-2023]MDO6739061.1 DUF2306 domain-containing protein [Wenyingzhuangia sp. 2_MG-2023]MDO6803737.1 DUF2306 domain-containing protein [Wenyingzhuangia sp. 1_MG-2023]